MDDASVRGEVLLAVEGATQPHRDAHCSVLGVFKSQNCVGLGVHACQVDCHVDGLRPTDTLVDLPFLLVGAGRKSVDDFLGEFTDEVVVVHRTQVRQQFELDLEALIDCGVADAD